MKMNVIMEGRSSGLDNGLYSSIRYRDNKIWQTSFKEVALHWLADQESMLKPNSINRYNFLLERHILPEIGNLEIREINSEKIRKFVSSMSESDRIDGSGGLSNSTVNDMLILIKSILSYIEEKYSVTVSIGKIKIPQKKQQVDRFYSSKDINLLIVEAWKRFGMDNSDLRCLGVLLCIYTGVRISDDQVIIRLKLDKPSKHKGLS